MRTIKKALIVLLAVISAAVFVLQVRADSWFLICLYWLILTAKNTIDVCEKWGG